jgi:ABC-type nitrate/sulfonate/bicarbonate transport system substrate-binding protein
MQHGVTKPAPGSERELIALGTQWFLNTDHVPFLAANATPEAAAAGLRLCLLDPVEHEDSFELVARKKLDFGLTEGNHLVTARDNGLPLVCIARYMQTVGGVLVLEGSGITSLARLAGKRIGYPDAPSRRGNLMLQHMIAHAGGPPAAEFEAVDTHYYFPQALIDKRIDAGYFAYGNQELPWLEARGHPGRVFDIAAHGLPDFSHILIVAHADTVAERPGLVAAMRRLTAAGIAAVRAEPERWKAALLHIAPGEAGPGFDEQFRRTVDCFTTDFDLPAGYWRELVDFFARKGLCRDGLDPEGFYLHGSAAAG